MPPQRLVVIATLAALECLMPQVGARCAAPPAEAVSEQAGPEQVIAELAARLFAALDRDAAVRRDPDKALPLIDQLLAPHFDADYTARLVLGQHWNAATAPQRRQFAAAFYQRLLRTYVGAVAEWTRDRFKLLPLRGDAAALQETVHTQVINAHGAAVPVDYRLRQTTEGWKVFDVVVDGVSYVRSYHDDVDSDVTRNGIDAATLRLERHDTNSGAARQ